MEEKSWFEDESDEDCSYADGESGSETEVVQSQTSEDESEIDLQEINTNEDPSGGNLFSFRSGITWSSIPSHSSKTKRSNVITEKPEPTEFTKNIASIEDAFLCFISEKMLSKILVYSNMEGHLTNASDDEWEPITLIELKAFIGLLLLAGLFGKSKKSIKSLWNRSPLESSIFRATMSRNRFETIILSIRFDDKTTRDERKRTDRFAAFREIWSDFRGNSKKCYKPGPSVTIDDQLLGFKGRCPFRQYISSKPDKYGIKLWLCVDVDSYYIFDAFSYIRRQLSEQRQKYVGANVVLELMKPMYGSSRNVTIDNLFTSIPLAKELQTKQLTLIGTLRKNKSEILMEFQSNTNREIGSSIFGFHDNLTLVSLVPKKNKAVLLLSSMHHDNRVDIEAKKSNIILDYNKTKGAVDTVDEMCHKYSIKRGTRRWPLCVFYGLIDASAINAMIIWRKKNPNWNGNKKYKRRIFLEELGTLLTSHLLDFRSKNSKTLHKDIQNALAVVGYPHIGTELHASSANSTQSKRKRCSLCDYSSDGKVSNSCYRCSEPICKQHSVKRIFVLLVLNKQKLSV